MVGKIGRYVQAPSQFSPRNRHADGSRFFGRGMRPEGPADARHAESDAGCRARRLFSLFTIHRPMTLPGSPHVAYRGGTLFVEDRSLAALATEFGTPLYVYSQTAMREAAAAWRRALAGRDHLV